MYEAEDETLDGQVGPAELFVAGGEPARLFGFADDSFNSAALPVDLRHDVVPRPGVGPGGDVVGDQPQGVVHVEAGHADRVGVGRLVVEHVVEAAERGGRLGKNRGGQRGVVTLTLGQRDGGHVVLVADDDHHLGLAAAPRPADRAVRRAPFFFGVPAECWCARTTVESIMIRLRPAHCGSAAFLSKSLFSRPEWPERLSRLYTADQSPSSVGRSRQGQPTRAQ
jgi:hypothetical protein